jgi:hypothetical protein
MSAVQATSARPLRSAPQPARQPAPRPRLRVVPAPKPARTRVPFVMTCIATLAASLLGALLLNTSMAQGEYQRYELATRLAQTAQTQQEIRGRLEELSSPQSLAAAAAALGMVPTTSGGYLRLADGAVLGNPVPAGNG